MIDPDQPPSDEKQDATQIRGASIHLSAPSYEDPPTVVQSSTKISSATTSGTGSGATGSGSHGSDPHRNDQMPSSGTKIGIYELGPPIGIGGMATVYAAQDLSLERTVALKILPPKSSQDNEVLQRFILEGKAAAQLDHPNIARIHALGHDGSYYFLAFEYVEGRTIRQWIEDQGQVDILQVLDWSIQAADALAHADHRGVVHRDIKPSNLIVTPGGQIKLVDLGLARRYETQGQVDLTQSGVTLGTFDYISPEQARDPRNVDIRSDLYSLGCTIFHMLAGQPPFPGQNVVQKLLQHQEKAPPDLRDFNPDVPDALARLVKRLMAKSPADRPASAELCAHELREIVADLRAASATNTENEVEPNSFKGTMLWVLPALLMALLVTAGSWFLGDKDEVDGTANQRSEKNGPAQNNSTATPTTNALESTSEPVAGAIVPVPLVPLTTKRMREGSDFQVADGSQLIDALKKSTAGSVITLTQAGPYQIAIEQIPELVKTDLVIKAATGVKPVLQPVVPQAAVELVEDQGPDALNLRLLNFKESRVQIQGLTFDMRGSGGSVPVSAILAEGCDLYIRDCRFLTDHAAIVDLSAFVQIRKKLNDEQLAWQPVRLENCRFWGPRIAVRAAGPVDLSISETASISSEPLVWIDQAEQDSLWPCSIQLNHVSVMATGWTPIIELNNTAARVRSQNSLFAPSPGGQISLVSSRKPSSLDWFGRNNIYGEVTTFLESTKFDEEILDFERWSRTGGIQREQNSLATKQSVFSPVDSAVLAAQGRWSDAFALNRGPWTSMSAGVQAWADRAQLDVPILVAENTSTAVEKPVIDSTGFPPPASELLKPGPVNIVTPKLPAPTEVATVPPEPMPMQVEISPPRIEGTTNSGTRTVTRPDNTKSTNREKDINEPVAPDSERSFLGLGERRPNTTVTPITGPNQPANADIPTAKNISESTMLVQTLNDRTKTGGNLIITGVRELAVEQAIKTESGKWQISSEPGAPRPLIRFKRLKQPVVDGSARWSVGQGAVIKFRGIDIYWDSDEPVQSRLFEIAIGAQVVFEDCTLTLKGQREDLVLFSMTQSEVNLFDDSSTQKASIRLIDSIVRTSGGLFRVRSDIRSDLELTDSLCVTGSPLISISSPNKLESTQTSKLQLNQTTAILGSSLASVTVGRGPVDSPILALQSRRSIIATNPLRERSMLDVRGGDPNLLDSEAVSWDGDEVGYHQWQTYRSDQNDLSGMSVRRQNREDWQLNHAENDTQPVHGDLGFERDFWSLGRPVWQAVPTDFTVRETGPGQGLGAKMDRLPQVPGPFSEDNDALGLDFP